MKTATGKNQPKYSHLFEMLLTAFGKEDLKLYKKYGDDILNG